MHGLSEEETKVLANWLASGCDQPAVEIFPHRGPAQAAALLMELLIVKQEE